MYIINVNHDSCNQINLSIKRKRPFDWRNTHLASMTSTCEWTTLQNSNMAAEEGRIQRIVREIVSSEIGEPNLPTNAQIYQSNREAPVKTGGGFENVNEELWCRFQIPRRFPANGDTVNVLSPRCSLLTQKGKPLSRKLLSVSIYHSIMVEEWTGEDHVARELFLTHMEARGVHHVPSPVPAVLRQLSTTKMLFCFPSLPGWKCPGETINHNYKSVDATLMLFVFQKLCQKMR